VLSRSNRSVSWDADPRSWGTLRGTIGLSGKDWSIDGGWFHVMFLQYAQECAHPIVTISVTQIRELIALQAVSAKAAVFQKYASKIRLHQENSQDPQVLARTILAGPR
jgi:hypothetical protein